MLETFSRLFRPRSKDQFHISYEGRSFSIPKREAPDHILRSMMRSRTFYEVDLLRYLQSLVVPKPGIAIDCGANIGNHSLFFSGVLGLETFAIEPVSTNRRILEALIEANGLAHKIHVVENAISDAAGSVLLSTPRPENPGMARIGDEGEKATAVTLDRMIADAGIEVREIRLIKIDVEGHELNVLSGGEETVAGMDGILVAELATAKDFNAFSDRMALLQFHPSAVHCATPTVVFLRDEGASKRIEIESKIQEFELRQGELVS